MKRFIFLGIYAIVVIGGSYLSIDNPMLPTILYVLLAILGIGICGMLLPGISGANHGGGHYGRADLNYIKAEEKIYNDNETHLKQKTKFSDIDFVAVFTVIYLFIPIIVAILLFV